MVEDPGVANFALGLNESLYEKNIFCDILAIGTSRTYLRTYKEKLLSLSKITSLKNNYDFIFYGTSEVKNSNLYKILNKFKSEGSKVGIIIDAPNSINERLNQINKNLQVEANFFIVADKTTKKELIKYKIKKEKIFEVLNPKFCWIQKINKIHKKKTKKKKIIFLSELSTGLDKKKFLKNNNYNLSGFTNSEKRTEIVFEELILALKKYDGKFSLTLKLHPKEKKSSYIKYKNYYHHIFPTEGFINNFMNFDLVVGITTNMLCELRTLNIPCLSITPQKEEFHWLNSDVKKFIHHAYSSKLIDNFFIDFFNNAPSEVEKFSINKKTFSTFIKQLYF